ncbi:Daunorubicin/doxorubicin resistance ATP-binding protein DrrA [Hartmannibacter diazotrophicus]|uniref:Daunorubicin/doxorubicin resistance ATP-binding protein DrrA n=1 Tax=Hartmannibacter diazotrophicus TaxID=1482074 RepID=A0A2C9DC15_9HYPH|nr:ABC transporter ATP-binding protein [Hartmannibacter diazotrophicus]SON57847.1 Daunorubicin/doxorubicin resistance ATP-binding protein DrrA [Hartmannibacter diazotrophicus]
MAGVTEERAPLLETRLLDRHYGGVAAVDGVDFKLEAGEIRAIIGPNGAGKSTFVGLVSGRVLPDSGTILFDGEDITRLPAYKRVRRGIAYTFQITNIYPGLTAAENVAIAVQGRIEGQRGHATPAAIRSGVADALAAVGLGERAGEMAGVLAYGHQRLLEVAMGLALKPRLLVLDEPTQGLSDAEAGEFCDLIEEVAKGTTVLLIEHNMDVVMRLARRITVMDGGRVLAEGAPEDIRANRAVQEAYLGTSGDAAPTGGEGT